MCYKTLGSTYNCSHKMKNNYKDLYSMSSLKNAAFFIILSQPIGYFSTSGGLSDRFITCNNILMTPNPTIIPMTII